MSNKKFRKVVEDDYLGNTLGICVISCVGFVLSIAAGDFLGGVMFSASFMGFVYGLVEYFLRREVYWEEIKDE